MRGQGVLPQRLARSLRHEQTDAERKLWTRLRARQIKGAKFRRQHSIGRYIADFCCIEHRLIVEVDGGQHAAQVHADRVRTEDLHLQGYRVLRFWDHEVLSDLDVIVCCISDVLSHPHPDPLPSKGRGEAVRRGLGKRVTA